MVVWEIEPGTIVLRFSGGKTTSSSRPWAMVAVRAPPVGSLPGINKPRLSMNRKNPKPRVVYPALLRLGCLLKICL